VLSGTQQAPRNGILLLRVRAVQPANAHFSAFLYFEPTFEIRAQKTLPQ